MRVLAVSGSLRSVSTNTFVLRACAVLAPAGVEVALFSGLAELPHFNPDLEAEAPPAVGRWAAQLREAGAVLFCTPEYAHGVPGALKNALDWVVGSGELVDKPAAVINAAPLSAFAPAQLAETLRVMSARLVPGASITLPFAPVRRDDAAIAADPALAGPLRAALAALVAAA